MRLLLLTVTITFVLAACGYRTPLSLPKPAAKPPTTNQAPAPDEAK